MFGMSRDDRRRLEDVEAAARETRERAEKSAADLAAHTALCTERHNTIKEKLADLGGSIRWINRQGILILLATLGAILLGIAEHKGLF
jgi:hypothetical protein